HLAPCRATLVLSLEDAPALRVAQPFPQPALEPDWIARLLLSRLEAAARARTCTPIPSNGTTSAAGQLPAVRNLGESMSSSPSGASDGLTILANGTVSAIWRKHGGIDLEGPPDEHPEPRIASVLLALDRLSDPATRQLPAFEARTARWEELRWSLERIRHRFGEGRLWRASVERPTAALPEHRSRLVDIGQ
ncbi:MAG: hypothetical protein ACRDGB_11335, partial [Candidatus Limnocylindria bacterium]